MKRWIALVTGLVAVAAVVALAMVGQDLWFHLRPLEWSDEPDRLAERLRLRPGQHIADIGAGSGALIVEVAWIVGPGGVAYASEMSPAQREAIAARARSRGIGWMRVIEAHPRETGLPDGCCHAVVMRMVSHHIEDLPAFAIDLARVLRPGGYLAVIDFPPGAMPHLGRDHGRGQDDIVAALSAAGLRLDSRDDQWGGRTYLLLFTK